jgi:putative acyl-CoA dehydrogenase
MAKTPEALDAFWAEVETARGANTHLDAWVDSTKADFSDFETIEFRARRVVEKMGLALQGSLLVRNSPPEVADAFCASRLGGDHGRAYGTLPPGVDVGSIIERNTPHVA